jgi:hypothetical protein
VFPAAFIACQRRRTMRSCTWRRGVAHQFLCLEKDTVDELKARVVGMV